MVLKIYRANYLYKLVLMVDVKGQTKIIEFGGGSRYTGTKASYSTADTILQEALEKNRGFGTLFHLEDKIIIKEERPKEPNTGLKPDGITIPYEFANFNELRDFLVKEKGKAPISVSTMEKATSAMDKLGLKFIMK